MLWGNLLIYWSLIISCSFLPHWLMPDHMGDIGYRGCLPIWHSKNKVRHVLWDNLLIYWSLIFHAVCCHIDSCQTMEDIGYHGCLSTWKEYGKTKFLLSVHWSLIISRRLLLCQLLVDITCSHSQTIGSWWWRTLYPYQKLFCCDSQDPQWW